MDFLQNAYNLSRVDTLEVRDSEPFLIEHFVDEDLPCRLVSNPLGLSILCREVSSGEECDYRTHLASTFIY